MPFGFHLAVDTLPSDSGQMLSAGVTMIVFSLFLGRSPIVPDLYPVFLAAVRSAFVLYALLCSIGVFASLARGTRGLKTAPPRV